MSKSPTIEEVVEECIAESNRTRENEGEGIDAASDIVQRLYDVWGVKAVTG